MERIFYLVQNKSQNLWDLKKLRPEMVGKDHSKVIRDIRNITSHLNEAKNGSVKIEDYFTFQQK